MEVCYRGSHDSLSRGCCNRRMEKKFHATAEQLYAQSLRQSSSYLRNILSANSLHYQDQFLQMISSAENATESVFRHSFDIPIRDSRSPIESLFLDLQAFLKHQDVDLHDSLLTFFDELFPVIYHYTLNDPTVVDIDQDYADCLMEIRQDLNPQPFGDAPARLAHRFSKSFGAARAFLDAMTVGMEVVNTTEYLTVDNSCSRAVTRMTYCSQCHGLRGAFPCHNMCMNIMRGCLVHVVNLDSSWNAFVDGLSELTSGMKGVYDLEEALQGFADAVSDAIMYAMNTPRKYISQLSGFPGNSFLCSSNEAFEVFHSVFIRDDNYFAHVYCTWKYIISTPWVAIVDG
ncbi:hypothetical protein CAPTEDRAFT_215229 [Capitella teleta]|uniref:Uncharacterized protein n=1 Tax=Capitella teleta TaxID=283909 RepID=R7VLA5_CAPTE|nr:hypothetical protein CAPTEDRAFT_215229 [Capitella teleta]|eukprot:ELU17455.1 hypothetical protein CAPTEDRAFT_215229 [Capitella teleta]